MSDGAVVGIVIGALVAVGLLVALVFALAGGDDRPQAAGTTDTIEDDTTGASQSDDPATAAAAPGPDDEPEPPGATDTTVPGGEPAISSVAAEQLFGAGEFTFVALAADDLATAKREFLATEPSLEAMVGEIAVREIERDGTSVGAVFAVSFDESQASAPPSAETFLAGAKERLGGEGEDLVLAGQPAVYGETAGVPFVVSLKGGIFLFVLGEDRSTCEQAMTQLLGNIP